MIAKGGDRLLETAAVAALKSELLPLAHIVTPNIPEAEVLAEMPIRSLDDMLLAGDRIRQLGPRVVLVKLPASFRCGILLPFDRGRRTCWRDTNVGQLYRSHHRNPGALG